MLSTAMSSKESVWWLLVRRYWPLATVVESFVDKEMLATRAMNRSGSTALSHERAPTTATTSNNKSMLEHPNYSVGREKYKSTRADRSVGNTHNKKYSVGKSAFDTYRETINIHAFYTLYQRQVYKAGGKDDSLLYFSFLKNTKQFDIYKERIETLSLGLK